MALFGTLFGSVFPEDQGLRRAVIGDAPVAKSPVTDLVTSRVDGMYPGLESYRAEGRSSS